MKGTRFFLLMLLCLLLMGTANADVLFDETLSAFPVEKAGGGYEAFGPLPFDGEDQGEGLLEIWFGRVSVCDCFVVRCNGETMMIDGGTTSHSEATRLLLDKLHITGVDYLFNTHSHDDHLQAQEYLVRKLGFNAGVFLSPYEVGTGDKLMKKMWATVENRQIPVRTLAHGDTLMLGGEEGALVQFFRWTGSTNLNETSMMCKITYKDRSVYLMADVIGKGQKALVREYMDEIPFDADIFKLGHHGYNRQETEILDAISPELCVVTNSAAGAKQAIDQLKGRQMEYRITNAGTIYARTDGGENWYYTQDKSYKKN